MLERHAAIRYSLKLAMELDKTQEAINRTMQLVNDHSDILRSHDEAIRRVGEFSKFIDNKLNAFMHAVEGQFLRTSIEDILTREGPQVCPGDFNENDAGLLTHSTRWVPPVGPTII